MQMVKLLRQRLGDQTSAGMRAKLRIHCLLQALLVVGVLPSLYSLHNVIINNNVWDSEDGESRYVTVATSDASSSSNSLSTGLPSAHPSSVVSVQQQALSINSSPVLSGSSLAWKNDFDLVHVVLTRFMQHQPNLLHLGRARLELFRTFCLPTLLQQTTKQFLWIIRVDPDLHPELKSDLLSLLSSPEVKSSGLNVLVVASNARIDNGHFRTLRAVEDINASTIWLGSQSLFRSYFRASQSKVVVETGLDADDGLALHYILKMQEQTAYTASRQTNKRWWKIWCIESGVEWQYYGDYLNSSIGSLREITTARRWCLTPGLTRVSTSEHKRYKEMLVKYEGKNSTFEDLRKDGTGFFVDHFFVKAKLKPCRQSGKGSSNCYSSMSTGYTQAIRARSPTSAGMKDIQIDSTSQHTNRDMSPRERAYWESVVETFGISFTTVLESRSRIDANLPFILQDALSGQCTEGHTCKESAKGMLIHLLNSSTALS